jgi:predicted DNA binding CopG/RHH family protein
MKPETKGEKSRARLEEQKALEESELKELADYYDRTDTGAFPWEEAEDAIIERPELEQISIRLPKEDIAELKRRASKAGIGYTTLLRMILREHLRSPLRRL